MAVIGWMTVFLVFLGLELAQRALTTFWFACGALAAALAAFGLADMGTQLLWFVAVSFLSLAIVRPAAFLAAKMSGIGAGRRRGGRVHGATAGLE